MSGFPAPSSRHDDGAYREADRPNPAEDAVPRPHEVRRAEAPDSLDPEAARRNLVLEATLRPEELEALPADRPVDRRLVFVVPLAIAAVAALAFGIAMFVSTQGVTSTHGGSFRWLTQGVGLAAMLGYLAYRTYRSPSF